MPSAERMTALTMTQRRRERSRRPASGRRGASRRSKRCSRCRSPTSCSARSRPIASTMRPTPSSSRTLLSIKTGGCPEDCGYCPQAKRYHTGVEDEALLRLSRGRRGGARREGERRDALLHGRGVARTEGARPRAGARHGARGEGARPRDLLHARACSRTARPSSSRTAGLDYYNHNLDTAPEFYGEVITTRDLPGPARYAAIACAMPASTSAAAGSSEWASRAPARAGLIAQLANLDPYPESVPINHLVQVEGTPLHDRFGGDGALDPLEFVRTIAVARITMPKAMRAAVRRASRDRRDAVQALCFLAGANSIFYGDRC